MSKDDATWLRITYVAFGFLLFYFLNKFITTFGIYLNIEGKYQYFDFLSRVLSVLLSFLVIYAVSFNKTRHDYFLKSIGELRKISWPNFENTKKMTLIVVAVIAVFTVILSVFDVFWGWVIKSIIVY
jgi:preprotein translocase subunit SecE